MDKIILVDGNNLLFRSYFATAYTGNIMKNSKGFPTNAIYGFVNMINKIVEEENPVYILVAFDKGKTFRHEAYADYKGGRNATPEELKMQMPLAREVLTYMGIKYYEIDNYEADDIIGTFSEYCNKDKNYVGTIISSDKDLLQLVSDDVNIKLLKMKDYIRYDKESFEKEYGIDPKRVVDLKALMGDASDNIPGVKGIGEKTALKLLRDYRTLDGIYEHINEISGKLKEKLETDKENAYMSYNLATIVKNVPVDINLDDIKLKEPDFDKLYHFYENLEFKSLIKKRIIKTDLTYKEFTDKDKLYNEETALYLEMNGNNYHMADIIGFGVYSEHNNYYVSREYFLNHKDMFDNLDIITYDVKRFITALKWQKINSNNKFFDILIAAFLLDYDDKDDIVSFAENRGYSFDEDIKKNTILKAKFIYDIKKELYEGLEKEELLEHYNKIEIPLTYVLSEMELNGVNVNKNTLEEMNNDLNIRIKEITDEIYKIAGAEFNISSPKQLSEILFDKLELKHGNKKGKNGYSTSIDVLNKLKGEHPIIDLIIEYRLLTKLSSTYAVGLSNYILKDNKIHTIFTQTLTRTGRLSSIEPNLQNIPARNEFGKLIRKAFVPSENSVIMSADYSQIELRLLAHMSGVQSLIDAFNNDVDIHTKTASDILGKDEKDITSNDRRIAKAVNFGIIYGISSYGLSENLDMKMSDAKAFIDSYFNKYPGVKEYMDNCIKKAYETGYVKTLFNRKRNIPELKDSNYMTRMGGERIALNTPIQGTSADIIEKAMIEMQNALKKRNLKTKMILQVHDELVFDCPKNELDEVIELVKKIMENTYKLSVPLKVDINYGDNWYLAK